MDWSKVPTDGDSAEGTVMVSSGEGRPMTYTLRVRLREPHAGSKHGFIESDGYVAIEAADTSSRTADGETHWEELPGYGETKSAMTVFPVTAESNTDSKAALEYTMYLYDAGDFQLQGNAGADIELCSGARTAICGLGG